MKRIIVLALSLILVAVSSQVYAQSKNHKPKEKPPSVKQLQSVHEFMDYKNIKRNAQGYGLTTYENNKVELFKVKFVGLYPLYASVTNSSSEVGKDSMLILVSLEKHFVTVAGMSGSPVYFKGKDGRWKLVGGLGYGFSDKSFPINYKSNVSGITPIKYMINQKKIFGAEKDNSKTSVKYYRPKPGEMIFFTIAEPNNGFGCTITYVEKNRFWACAHAFTYSDSDNRKNLWLGKINIPAYRADTITTVKGKMESYKIMKKKIPSQYIGSITYDNEYAIEGVLGAPAKLINLYVHIEKPTLKKSDWQKLSVSPTIFANDDLFNMTFAHLFSYWPNETSTVIIESKITIGGFSIPMFAADLSSGEKKATDVWALIAKTTDILSEAGNADWAKSMPSGAISIKVVPGNKFLSLAAKSITEDTSIKDPYNRHFNLFLKLKNSDNSKTYDYKIPFAAPKEYKQISLEIYSLDDYFSMTQNDSLSAFLLVLLCAFVQD
jgi:hypothetical protein